MRSCGPGAGARRSASCAIASTKEAGYDLIEFPVFQPAEMDIPAIARSLAAHELGVTCSLGLVFDNDINSEDPDSVARGEQSLNDALSAARDMGSSYLGGVIYSALGPYADMPTARRPPQLGRASSVAWRRGRRPRTSRSASRFVNRYESNLLNTAAQTVDYIGEVGAPNVVVHLDSYHMNIEENDFRQSGLRRRRPPWLRPHRREPPRLPGPGAHRLPAALRGPGRGRLRRRHHLRVVLVGGREPGPVADPAHLARHVDERHGPRRPGASLHRRADRHSRGLPGLTQPIPRHRPRRPSDSDMALTEPLPGLDEVSSRSARAGSAWPASMPRRARRGTSPSAWVGPSRSGATSPSPRPSSCRWRRLTSPDIGSSSPGQVGACATSVGSHWPTSGPWSSETMAGRASSTPRMSGSSRR